MSSALIRDEQIRNEGSPANNTLIFTLLSEKVINKRKNNENVS